MGSTVEHDEMGDAVQMRGILKKKGMWNASERWCELRGSEFRRWADHHKRTPEGTPILFRELTYFNASFLDGQWVLQLHTPGAGEIVFYASSQSVWRSWVCALGLAALQHSPVSAVIPVFPRALAAAVSAATAAAAAAVVSASGPAAVLRVGIRRASRSQRSLCARCAVRRSGGSEWHHRCFKCFQQMPWSELLECPAKPNLLQHVLGLQAAGQRIRAAAEGAGPAQCADLQDSTMSIEGSFIDQLPATERAVLKEAAKEEKRRNREISENSDRLQCRLKGAAARQLTVADDGNCQFRAASLALWGSQRYHIALRAAAVHWLRENHAEMQWFGATEEYIADMAKLGTWGDALTVRAISEVTGAPVTIASSAEGRWAQHHEGSGVPIVMAYIAPVHYNCVADAAGAESAEAALLADDLDECAARLRLAADEAAGAGAYEALREELRRGTELSRRLADAGADTKLWEAELQRCRLQLEGTQQQQREGAARAGTRGELCCSGCGGRVCYFLDTAANQRVRCSGCGTRTLVSHRLEAQESSLRAKRAKLENDVRQRLLRNLREELAEEAANCDIDRDTARVMFDSDYVAAELYDPAPPPPPEPVPPPPPPASVLAKAGAREAAAAAGVGALAVAAVPHAPPRYSARWSDGVPRSGSASGALRAAAAALPLPASPESSQVLSGFVRSQDAPGSPAPAFPVAAARPTPGTPQQPTSSQSSGVLDWASRIKAEGGKQNETRQGDSDLPACCAPCKSIPAQRADLTATFVSYERPAAPSRTAAAPATTRPVRTTVDTSNPGSVHELRAHYATVQPRKGPPPPPPGQRPPYAAAGRPPSPRGSAPAAPHIWSTPRQSPRDTAPAQRGDYTSVRSGPLPRHTDPAPRPAVPRVSSFRSSGSSGSRQSRPGCNSQSVSYRH